MFRYLPISLVLWYYCQKWFDTPHWVFLKVIEGFECWMCKFYCKYFMSTLDTAFLHMMTLPLSCQHWWNCLLTRWRFYKGCEALCHCNNAKQSFWHQILLIRMHRGSFLCFSFLLLTACQSRTKGVAASVSPGWTQGDMNKGWCTKKLVLFLSAVCMTDKNL